METDQNSGIDEFVKKISERRRSERAKQTAYEALAKSILADQPEVKQQSDQESDQKFL